MSEFYIGSNLIKCDEAYIPLLALYTWRVVHGRGGGKYAVASKGRELIRMHRLIINARKGEVVDHINRDSLDNRRANLRIVTHSQNMRNKGEIARKAKQPKNIRKTRYGSFAVQFKLSGKCVCSRTFKTLTAAVLFRDQWMKDNKWME